MTELTKKPANQEKSNTTEKINSEISPLVKYKLNGNKENGYKESVYKDGKFLKWIECDGTNINFRSISDHKSIGGGNWIVPEEDIKNFYMALNDSYCMCEQKSEYFKLFFDIDFVGSKPTPEQLEKIQSECVYEYDIENIKRGVINTIQQKLNDTLEQPNTRYIYSISSNPFKLHLYYPKIIIDKNYAMVIRDKIINRLIELYKDIDCFNWEDVVDKAIFGTNGFRVLYQSKDGKNFYTIDEDKSTYDIPHDKIDQMMITRIRTNNKEPNVKYLCEIPKTTKKENHNINKSKHNKKFDKEVTTNKVNNTKDEAYIWDLLDNLNSDRYNNEPKWIEVMWMLRGNGYYDLMHKFSKKSTKYDENKINELINKASDKDVLGIGSLVEWSEADNLVNHEKIMDKYFGGVKYDNTDDILLAEHRGYVSFKEDKFRISDAAYEAFKKQDTIIIQSNTGSGKSFRIKQLIDEYEELSVLSITPNQSTACQQETTFGITNYMSIKEKTKQYNNEEKLIISFEQVMFIKRNYDIVILDEATSLLSHMKSKTMINLEQSYLKLIHLITNAKILIASDAIIRDDVMILIKGLRQDVFYYRNFYKCWKNVTINSFNISKQPKLKRTDKIRDFIAPLKDKIIKGYTCAILSDSKRICNEVNEIVKDWNKDKNYVILITSDHGKREEIREPNKYWKGHLVIFSPKILYGLDNLLKYDKDCIYVIYQGISIQSDQMVQQIGRFRNCQNINLLWINNNYARRRNIFISLENYSEYAKETLKSYILSRKKITSNFLDTLVKFSIKNVSNLRQIMKLNDELNDKRNEDNYETIDDIEKLIKLRNKLRFDQDNLFYQIYLTNSRYEYMFKHNKKQLFNSICEEFGYNVVEKRLEPIENMNYNDHPLTIKERAAIFDKGGMYILGELDNEDKDYDIISYKIDKNLKIFNLTREKVENDPDLVKLICDQSTLSHFFRSIPLIREEKADNIKEANVYLINEMKKKNPACLKLIEYLEQTTNIERFDIESMKINFKDIKKHLIDNEDEFKHAMYGFDLTTSPTYRNERTKNYLAWIENENDIKDVLADLYNKYDNFIVKVRTHRGKKYKSNEKILNLNKKCLELLNNKDEIDYKNYDLSNY